MELRHSAPQLRRAGAEACTGAAAQPGCSPSLRPSWLVLTEPLAPPRAPCAPWQARARPPARRGESEAAWALPPPPPGVVPTGAPPWILSSLLQKVVEGINAVEGCEAVMYQVRPSVDSEQSLRAPAPPAPAAAPHRDGMGPAPLDLVRRCCRWRRRCRQQFWRRCEPLTKSTPCRLGAGTARGKHRRLPPPACRLPPPLPHGVCPEHLMCLRMRCHQLHAMIAAVQIKPEPRADYSVIRPEELPDFDGGRGAAAALN